MNFQIAANRGRRGRRYGWRCLDRMNEHRVDFDFTSAHAAAASLAAATLATLALVVRGLAFIGLRRRPARPRTFFGQLQCSRGRVGARRRSVRLGRSARR